MKPALRQLVVVTALTMALIACGDDDPGRTDTLGVSSPEVSTVPDTATAGSNPSPSQSESPTQTPPTPSPRPGSAGSFDRDLALPPAKDLDELAAAIRSDRLARPVDLTIDRIGLERTPVVSVGVLPNGEMEVPGPREIGWFRYGPEPGEAGSAVLAAHVASGGVDGAFRHLDRMQPGDRISVSASDGTVRTFEVTDLVQVGKTELPFDELFARSGEPRLALITCGGPFDYAARSYEDNIVVVASLVGTDSPPT